MGLCCGRYPLISLSWSWYQRPLQVALASCRVRSLSSEIRHSAAAALVAITLVAVGRDAATERAMMAVADTSCGDALAGPATRAAGAGAATTVADVAAPAAGLATAAATTAFAGLGQPSTAFAELQRDACTGTAMAGEASRAGTGEAAWTDMAGAGEAAWAACIACVSEGVRAEDQVWEGGDAVGAAQVAVASAACAASASCWTNAQAAPRRSPTRSGEAATAMARTWALTALARAAQSPGPSRVCLLGSTLEGAGSTTCPAVAPSRSAAPSAEPSL
eukprot:CAMPEP_0115860840 /NCGR_PEP_ID=MMETSP0287-20121206/17339_1 /TAXON_ID=412157 /ORGANISM="Chrysochromulina rotalis, Strain UIO044" /LENGTH=276 /DNA_ID=CAMNT_0003315185 /DNA_START=372 /DNA_END=1201 /DNA_ORIENTATION=+